METPPLMPKAILWSYDTHHGWCRCSKIQPQTAQVPEIWNWKYIWDVLLSWKPITWELLLFASYHWKPLGLTISAITANTPDVTPIHHVYPNNPENKEDKHLNTIKYTGTCASNKTFSGNWPWHSLLNWAILFPKSQLQKSRLVNTAKEVYVPLSALMHLARTTN